jgi:predicted dinucleotide-binding enzyme
LKSFIVFKLFQYEFLVNRSEQILNGLKTLLGKTLFSKLMKSTIFDQFIVGEDVEAMKTVLAKLKPFGIRPILAYSAEDNHHHHQMTSSLDDK